MVFEYEFQLHIAHTAWLQCSFFYPSQSSTEPGNANVKINEEKKNSKP